jgi:cation:H+ antiporter
MNILLALVFLPISILMIWKGADWLVDSAVKIANRFGISQLVIGLTIIAFGTSAPEFAVSVSSALRGSGDIAVANVVGSNIFNLGLILGLCAIFRPIKTTKKLVKRDCLVLLIGTIILTLFIFNLSIGRLEGSILFSLLLFYLFMLAIRKEAPEFNENVENAKWLDGIFLIIGLFLVVFGAQILINSAIVIAEIAGISEWAIGVTIVAFGTSVPELATSLTAAMRKYYGISAGNLIGSDIFNMFGVVGVAGLLSEMSFDPDSIVSVAILIGMVSLVAIFARTGWIISRREGLILVLISVARWCQTLIFS